ncbi:MAG: hypothetical protein ACLFPL_04760 [Candidatus Nanoarchaeia archaeon]
MITTNLNNTILRKITIIGFILISLIVAGCTDGSGGGNNSGSDSNQFQGGDEYVNIELEPGSPPEVVYDSQTSPFDIVLSVENQGEWDIEENSLRVLVEGFSEQSWGSGVKSSVVSSQLIGYDSFYDIEGDIEYITFDNLEYQEELNQNSYNHNYNVRSCYGYGSRVAFTACVDNEARRSSGSDDFTLCEGFSQRDFSVSSGPIGVSEVEQQVVNGKLRIIFTLNNKEFENYQVTLFSPETLNDQCRVPDGTSSVQVENSVQISLSNPTIGEFQCSADGRVTFPNSERRVNCEADISTLEKQEIPMILYVEYDVLDVFRDTITVERSN